MCKEFGIKIKQSAKEKCQELFPYGIRVGTKVVVKSDVDYLKSKAINQYCSPCSYMKDAGCLDEDFYKTSYTKPNGECAITYVRVENNTPGVVTYIYSNSSGEPRFHVYIEKIDETIFCNLDDFGIYDDIDDDINDSVGE